MFCCLCSIDYIHMDPVDMASAFMSCDNADLLPLDSSDSADPSKRLNNSTSALLDDPPISQEPSGISPTASQTPPDVNLNTPCEGAATLTSRNPTPSILIDNCEDGEVNSPLQVVDVEATDGQSDMNKSDHSGLTNHSEADGTKPSSDQEVDHETESDTLHHHSRLLRLLSGDLGSADASGRGDDAARSSPTSPSPILAGENETLFMPLTLPGVRLRARSLRAKDRIPSRVFRSLQVEFDSSTEDIVQATSPSGLDQVASSGSTNTGPFFRYSRLYASVTPETPSSATSELEGFFSSHPFH